MKISETIVYKKKLRKLYEKIKNLKRKILEYRDPPSNKNNIRVSATDAKANEHIFHGYKIRISRKPNEQGIFKAIAYLPGKNGKIIRQERFQGESVDKTIEAAKNWIVSYSKERSWNNIKRSSISVDFNREFVLNFLDGNEKFWNKFIMLSDGTPGFLIAPPDAEEDFGKELLRSYGYTLALPKKSPQGEIGNTSGASLPKSRAEKSGLVPNSRYTMEITNKKSKNFNSDLFTLAYHSTVDASNAPRKLGIPGATIAASRIH